MKTWMILKTEFINTVTRRSFILTLILVPLIPALILGGIAFFSGDDQIDMPIGIPQPEPEIGLADGFVDLANIITATPEWLSSELLVPFDREEAAQKAALAGEISGYYVIEADYLASGALRSVRDDFNPMDSMGANWVMEALIKYNLLGADQDRLELFQNPIEVQHFDLSPEDEQAIDMDNPVLFYIPYGMTFLFYMLILGSASLLMNSVAKEKENRVMEVLMSSVKPRQLLTGKILALGMVGMLQLVVWLGSALLMLHLGGSTLQIPSDFQLPAGILIWGILFFILGYLLYGTIMAGVGALVGSVKEASQATIIVIMPMLVPLMMVGPIIHQPNATFAVVLSLIPFTAPNTIMTRMAITAIPLWQLVLAVVLMVITIMLLIRSVSGMFRAQLLLTGQKFSLGTLFNAMQSKKMDSA